MAMAKLSRRRAVALVVVVLLVAAAIVAAAVLARKFCPLFGGHRRRELFTSHGHRIPVVKCKYVCEQDIPGTAAHHRHQQQQQGQNGQQSQGGAMGMPTAANATGMPTAANSDATGMPTAANSDATAMQTGNAPAPPPNAPVTCTAGAGWSAGSAAVGGNVTQACPDGSVNTATCGADGKWSITGCPGTAASAVAAVAAVVPVPGTQGRYIKLQNSGVHCAHFAEIAVYSSSGGANLAAQAAVTMSSQFGNTPGSTAIDGNTPGSNMVDGQLATFASTSCNEVPWVLVDMGSVITIFSIVLTNRQDCCQGRANGTVLTILDANQNVVYTANPIVDANGSTTYRDDGASAFKVFTYMPPSVAVVVA
jgi:hypothetical protein